MDAFYFVLWCIVVAVLGAIVYEWWIRGPPRRRLE